MQVALLKHNRIRANRKPHYLLSHGCGRPLLVANQSGALAPLVEADERSIATPSTMKHQGVSGDLFRDRLSGSRFQT